MQMGLKGHMCRAQIDLGSFLFIYLLLVTSLFDELYLGLCFQ